MEESEERANQPASVNKSKMAARAAERAADKDDDDEEVDTYRIGEAQLRLVQDTSIPSHIKLYGLRVHVPWYRRYVDLLEGDEAVHFQPFFEIANRDIELAMRWVYGEDYKKNLPLAKNLIKNRVALALKKFNNQGYYQFEEDFMNNFGPSEGEIDLICKGMSYMKFLHVKRAAEWKKRLRGNAPTHWDLLNTDEMREKIHAMYMEKRHLELRLKFTRTIHVISCVHRFFTILANKVSEGANKRLSVLTAWAPIGNSELTRVSVQKAGDPSVPMDIRLILTKPWHTRSTDEITLIVDYLQHIKRKLVNLYPLHIQKKIARVAWYTRLAKDQVIVREGHVSAGFYIVLSGRAKMSSLVDSTRYEVVGKTIRIMVRGEMFGAEDLACKQAERGYTVITMTDCELIYVSHNDYNKSMLLCAKFERAPKHIMFISKLPFLATFPNRKLLAVSEKEVHFLYFGPNTLVVASLEKSDFVFVVWQGNCRTLIENKPPQLDVDEYNRRRDKKNKDYKKYSAQVKRDSVLAFYHREFEKTKSGQITFPNKSIFKNFQRPCEKSKTKEEFKRNMEAILQDVPGRWDPNDFDELRRTIDKTADRIMLHERINQAYERETHDLKVKGMALHKILTRYADHGLIGRDIIKPYPEPPVEGGMSFTDAQTNENLNKNSTEEDTSEINVSSNAVADGREDDDDDDRNDYARGTRVNKEISFVDDNDEDDEDDDDDNVFDSDYFHRAANEMKGSDSERFPTTETRQRNAAASKGFKDRLLNHSNWAIEEYFTRGDVMGNAWVDYNNGQYRQPPADLALVSDGAELIMISKETLLEHMYIKKE